MIPVNDNLIPNSEEHQGDGEEDQEDGGEKAIKSDDKDAPEAEEIEEKTSDTLSRIKQGSDNKSTGEVVKQGGRKRGPTVNHSDQTGHNAKKKMKKRLQHIMFLTKKLQV